MAMGGMLGALAGGFRRNEGTGPLSEKSSEHLVEGTFKQGITHYYCERESGKAWKRRIKKEQQRINHRDRRFRDRTRKLTLVFMGESDNIRRYVFSAVMPSSKYLVTADIVNKAVPFLDVWNKEEIN